jgi:hypothetical protein
MKAGLKRFSNHVFLKRLGRDLLTRFIEHFPTIEAPWPDVCHDSHSSHSALDCYSTLAAFFLRPERLPAGMMDELLAIEEMCTAEGLARLQRAAEWPRLEGQLRPDSTVEDIAMQIWLLAPEVLAREHNVLRFRRLMSFEHAAHSQKLCRPLCRALCRALCRSDLSDLSDPADSSGQTDKVDDKVDDEVTGPDHLTIVNLTAALDRWFAFHARGAETTRVEVYPLDGELWFLIRHGDLCKRVARVERQRTDTVHFRPERDDVVVVAPRLNEMRVNARTKAERDLYVREFGRHLCGDENYFSERRPYTLEPLRELGRDAVDADGLEGIERIRLCRLAVRFENSVNESIVREADDLFSCATVSPFQAGPIPAQGLLERALFEVQFTGSIKSHSVEIRVPNTLKLSRRCDPEAVRNWLWARGFRRGCERERERVYNET